MKLKKIAPFILAACLLLSSCQGKAVQKTPAEEVSLGTELGAGEGVLRKGGLTLTVDKETAKITLTDSTGKIWRSNPEDSKTDPYAKGANKTKIESQLYITLLNKDGVVETVNTQSASVADGNFKWYKSGDALTCLYYLAMEGLTIPLRYTLTENGLTASVPVSLVKEEADKGCKLLELSVLPFFGAAGPEDKGLILTPDGSGSIINFNNGRATGGEQQLKIYGGDRAYVSQYKPLDIKPAYFPMFGILYEEQTSLMAVADKGEAGGKLSAISGGQYSSQNQAYFTFVYRAHENITLLDRTWAAKNMEKLAAVPAESDAFQVTYTVLGKGGIADLATAYRNVLVPEGTTKAGEIPPLFLQAAMGVRSRHQTLGVAYNALTPLTTFAQLDEMLSVLKENGAEHMNVQLNGLDSDGVYYGSVDNKLSVNGKLGKLSDIARLEQKYSNVTLYPQVNLAEFSRNGGGVSKFSDSVIGVSGKRVRIGTYSLSTADKDSSVPRRSLTVNRKLTEAGKKLADFLTKKSMKTLAVSDLAGAPYTSMGNEEISINQNKSILQETLALLSGQERSLMTDVPNAFVLPYAKAVTGLPVVSSGFDVCDGDVPFVSLVLHGLYDCAVTPVNRFGNPKKAVLAAIEGGVSVSFTVMKSDYDSIKTTTANEWVGSVFDDIHKDITEHYLFVKEALSGLSNQRVIQYEMLDRELRKITYENGAVILVNYGDRTREADGHTVGAMEYTRY